MATLTKTELKKYLKECIREMIKEGNPDLKALVNECVVSSLGLGYQQKPMFQPQQQAAPSPYGNLVNQFAGNDPTQQLIFGDIANKMYQAELAERQALLEEQQYEMMQQQQRQPQPPTLGRGNNGGVPHSPYGQQPSPPATKSRWAELAFNTQPLNTDPRLLQ